MGLGVGMLLFLDLCILLKILLVMLLCLVPPRCLVGIRLIGIGEWLSVSVVLLVNMMYIGLVLFRVCGCQLLYSKWLCCMSNVMNPCIVCPSAS